MPILFLFLSFVLLVAGPRTSGALEAQTPPPTGAASPSAALTAAAESITAAELARHVGVIAHDSMGGRATPSRGLELAARYVADQFRALGLASGATLDGGDTSGIQFYPVPGLQRSNYDSARISFWIRPMQGDREAINENGDGPGWREVNLNFITDARPARDTARIPILTGGLLVTQRGVLVAGRHTVATLREAKLQDKFVLYVPPAGLDSATQRQVIEELVAKNIAVVVVSADDSVTFSHRAQVARQRPSWLANPYPYMQHMQPTAAHGWGAYVRAGALRDVLSILNVDLAQVRATAPPTIRRLPSLAGFNIDRALDTSMVKPIVAPNVIGVLQGSDSTREYVVLSAHLDNRGGPGANDNALGIAGLIALAKALSRPEARPRRSIIFLATSGGTEEFWGARYFLHESQRTWLRAPFALNLTLDMLGLGTHDSVNVAGLRDLQLPTPVDWLAAAHPELGLTVVDVGTAVTAESDNYAFVEAAAPSLYVSTGSHANPPPGPDTPAQLNTAQATRILKLVFYLTETVANADRKPRWSSEGRQRRRQVFGE